MRERIAECINILGEFCGKRYTIVGAAEVTIYESAAEEKTTDAGAVSNIADEGLHGMMFRITGKPEEGFCPVETFYGYEGYVKEEGLLFADEEEAKAWEGGHLMVTSPFCVDVVSVPKVQGVRLESLYKGSLIEVAEWESEALGWAKVRLADGRAGYMRNQYLQKKEFSQSGLWTGKLPQKRIVEEEQFRKDVTETAKQFLGVQYRWGGRSSAGIDCSGLTSASYMLCGILTYRDAKIRPGFPVHEIPREEMLPGDLMYFPGHIAMYLGNGSYIHSTGRIGSGGVVINSLNPEAADYRADLAQSMTAAGSIF